MTLRADPAHLAALAGGRPLILVAEGVMDPSPLAVPGLEIWSIAARGGALLLHPQGTRAPDPEAAIPLATPPMGGLALVASDRARIAPVARWWAEAAGLPAPPFVPAATGQAALPGLLAILAAELAAAQARENEACRALVAARQEMEETREAMADTARLLAHRPPVAPRLILSGEAGAASLPHGRHALGTGLAGLAAIAVHLAGAAEGDGLLRFRLIGGESDRVLGAWAVPAAELAPGWLTLEFPTPLGPFRETAVLEVLAEGEGLPPLSAELRWAGTEGEHPLAIRAWAGAPGSRYLAPAHWAPEEVGLGLPGADVPLALPAPAWAAARVIEGAVSSIALGDEPPRPLLRAPAGERALLLLPAVHAPGLDRLRISFANGTGAGASVAAWLRPADPAPAGAADLGGPAAGAAESGWRALPEEGLELTLPVSALLGGRAALAIALRAGDGEASVEVEGVTLSAQRTRALPAPELPGEMSLDAPSQPEEAPGGALPKKDAGAGKAAATLPEISPFPEAIADKHEEAAASRPEEAYAVPAREATPPPIATPPVPAPAGPVPASPGLEEYRPIVLPLPSLPGMPAEPAPSAEQPAPPRPVAPPLRTGPINPVPGRAPARFEAVRLHQHMPGDSYRHIDITVASLASGPMRWAAVRVKLVSKDGEPRLEFRRATGWPQVFRDWLGRSSDKFGPFLRIALPELRDFLESITDERDAAMMQALFAVLPRAAEDACRQAGLSVADTAAWMERARELQETGIRAAA